MGNNSATEHGGLLAGRGPESLGTGAGLGGSGAAALVGGVLLISMVLAGNLLVCVSVASERTLQTPTNYFIVSLAAADLLLAVLVLPLFVYSEVRLGALFPSLPLPQPQLSLAALTLSSLEPGRFQGPQVSSLLTVHFLLLLRVLCLFCVCWSPHHPLDLFLLSVWELPSQRGLVSLEPRITENCLSYSSPGFQSRSAVPPNPRQNLA